MYAGAMNTWRWLNELMRTREQTFSKSIEATDSIEKEDRQKSYNLIWSFSDIVLVTICYQIDIIYLCNMGYMFKTDLNPGLLQIMMMYTTWGPALMYLEIFLGQYVQHGCLYLKNMSPLMCSTIGYGMLLTMYFFSVAAVTRLADSYLYLLRSFSSELPWMVCPKDSTPANCIDRALLIQCYVEKRQENCYPKLGTELLSSRIYYKTTHSTFANCVTLLFFGWLTIYIALRRSFSDTRVMIKKLLLFMLILFLSLLMPLMAHIPAGLAIAPFFSLWHGALSNMTTWIRALKYFLSQHAIARGAYQLIGSHIKPGSTAANLTIYSCILTYMLTVCSQIFSTGILGVLIFYMKITQVEKELYFPKYAKLYSFYPFALGMLEVRQVWSLIFFVFIALSAISYTVVNIAVVEESMYDEFPVLLKYQGYVKVILCILGFLISTLNNLLIGSETYKDDIVLQIGYRLTIIVILILTFSVGYIYGMERFSDDMNFLNGSQPTTYWKICWKSLPFGILILLGGEVIAIEFPRNDVARMAADIVYVILLSLAILQLLYQIIMSIKARNVTGMLFQATPLWGPPHSEDRRMRNKYNPREETKYWRKNNLCTHRCLLDKKFIFSIIFREIDSRTSRIHDETLQPDFTAVEKQSKQNQVIIAIDKVSSEQLKTFEEQVKQRVKLLEQVEQMEIGLKRRKAIIGRNNVSRTTRSMEELDYKIEEMIKEAERQRQLEKANNGTRLPTKTLSKTKQRRLPTLVPKETPRPKKMPKAAVRANQNGVTDKGPAKVHTYMVRVPHFVLEPKEKIIPYPANTKSPQKKVNPKTSRSSPLRRNILQTEDGPSPAIALNNSRSGLPESLGSKSTSCRMSRRQTILQSTIMIRSPHLPVWPLPPNTPRPVVSPRLSQSSSSMSTTSREAHCQPSDYFLNVRLPPKANLPLHAFSVHFHSLSERPTSPGSSGSSIAPFKISELTNDPVPRNSLSSVRTLEALVRPRHEALHPQPQPRTSITRGSSSIPPPVGSPLSPRPLPRKRKLSDPPVPSPRKRSYGENISTARFEDRISGFSRSFEEDGSGKKKVAQKTNDEGSTVDINQAIQIRIQKLLQGVRDPGHSTDQRRTGLSVIPDSRKMSQATREQCGAMIKGKQEKGTFQNTSRISNQQTTSSVAARISALGKKIAKKMMRDSTSPRICQVPRPADGSHERFETTAQDVPEENKLDLTLMQYKDGEQSTMPIRSTLAATDSVFEQKSKETSPTCKSMDKN